MQLVSCCAQLAHPWRCRRGRGSGSRSCRGCSLEAGCTWCVTGPLCRVHAGTSGTLGMDTKQGQGSGCTSGEAQAAALPQR